MTTITILSNELIDIILQQANVSVKDVVSFGSTCTRFLALINDNNLLWQKKLYQRWPYLKRIYDKRIRDKEDINFKDDVKESIKFRNELRCFLSMMSEMFFRKNELTDVDLGYSDTLFCPSMGAHTRNYYFLVDELLEINSVFPDSTTKLSDYNLTHVHYSRKLLPYVQQRYLKDIWQEFISCPRERQLLERVAFIVAQWYQPQKRIFYLDVEASLDNIAQQVLESLRKAHRGHPIFSTSAKQFSFWKYNNISGNHWSRDDERQIIDVLRTVLFDELGFCGASLDRSGPEAEHILIDCVLENKVGNVVSLAIIFQSVARRLGVRCDLVCFPTHFFLCWKPKCDTENLKDEEYFYIDVLHGGLIRSKNDCPRTRGRRCPIESFNEHNEMSPTEMVLRMINSLQMSKPYPYQNIFGQIRSLMEFRYMIEPHNIDVIENLGRHYLNYNINISGLITTLQKLLIHSMTVHQLDLTNNHAVFKHYSKKIEETFKKPNLCI